MISSQSLHSSARRDNQSRNANVSGSSEQNIAFATIATASHETESWNFDWQTTTDYVRAANDDLTPVITNAEYLEGVRSREELLQESIDDLQSSRNSLATTKELLVEVEADALAAWIAFGSVESSGDREALTDAWVAVRSALDRWNELGELRDREQSEVEDAENSWEKNSIWLEKYKNDYEAQSDTFGIRDAIAQCALSDCSATSFLVSKKFSVFQPTVLKMVGVHHAYAKGLTGKGVRIGIEDDIVNYRLPEFAERISFSGARLTYPLFNGDNADSDAKQCEQASEAGREELKCKVISYSSEHDLLDTLTARWTVANYGWPEEGGNWFIRNDAYEEGDFSRWAKIPHGTILSHGTTVASVAAGRDFGVAPGATIVPLAQNFDPDAQSDQRDLESALLFLVSILPAEARRVLDSELAETIKAGYSQYDVINRSYGIGVFDPASIAAVLDDETQWWGEGLREILPQTWRAYMQTGTHPEERTIVVYATGNQTQEFGGFGAEIPYFEPHVRGSQLAVMAVDHGGSHADYTNFCGPLPADWDAGRWGRHFCLAAPGTVNSIGSRGRDYIFHEMEGTSFAAPVVTGAIALLMEHFRGQLGNTEIVKRVVNTANNKGRYAQLEIYGAGLLDLEAALNPVGEITTGTPAQINNTTSTFLSAPPAIGNLGGRLAASGVEVASLDSLGAPFWSSPERFMLPVTTPPVLIPAFADPREHGGGIPHLGFTPGTVTSPLMIGGHVPSLGATSFTTSSWERMTNLPWNAWHDGRGMNSSAFRLLMGKDRIGVEQAPAYGIRWGVLADSASWLGGHTSGAFGNDIESITAWVGRTTRFELDDAWSLNASATLGLGRAYLQPGAMFDADPYAMSTWDIDLEYGIRGSGQWSRIALSQPLRAETGSGKFTYLAGLKDGKRFYDHATVPLQPEGRELELALTHEAPVGWGRGIVKLAYSSNFRHVPGRTNWGVGVAYRVNL